MILLKILRSHLLSYVRLLSLCVDNDIYVSACLLFFTFSSEVLVAPSRVGQRQW